MYPVMLKMEGRQALVVGGGRVAERKARGLLAAGASVTVVSPKATHVIEDLHKKGDLVWKKRRFEPDDVGEAMVIITATDSPDVNEAVFTAGENAGKIVNSVDDVTNCHFIAPAVIRRGSLTIAVSTSGSAPYFARRLKEFLEKLLPVEISERLEELAHIRNQVLAENDKITQSERKQMVVAQQESIINAVLERML